MKKIAFVFFVSAFIFLNVLHGSVIAQTTTDKPGKTQIWSCLTAASKQAAGKRTVELSGYCQSDNKQCYIVACATTLGGSQCTTGNSQFDTQLGFAKSAINFSTDIEPLLQTTDNNILISASVPLDTIVYTFYAIGTATNDSEISTAQTCTPFHPAPQGIVFDSQSLEPISNVRITLLDSLKKQMVQKDVKNPIISNANGAYRFAPLRQDYFMNPQAPTNYSFINQAFIHPNVKKAYGPLYKPNQQIKLDDNSRYDIALNPGVNPPYRAQPHSLHFGTFQTGTKLLVAGVQTHPLTKIVFKQGDTEIMTADADIYGYYEAPILNDLVNVELPIDVYFTKIDLTTDKQTSTPQKAYTFDLYPPYVEGKAIDKKGNVIPDGVVSIILPSKAVYTQTTADGTGVFSFSSASVPPIPYSLLIENPNTHEKYELSLAEFALKNKDYLTMKNINLMTATKNGTHLIIEPSPTVAQTDPHIETNLPDDNTAGQGDATSISKIVIGLAVIFVVFVCMAGFYVYVSQKKKKQSSVIPSDESAPPLSS